MVIAATLFLALLGLWAAGPMPRRVRLDGPLPDPPPDAGEAARRLAERERAFPVRPDNQARILWGDGEGRATPWCFVYLHGYSATWREGDPVLTHTARRYGANLLFTRLAGHGLEVSEPLLDLDAADLWRDAKEALSLARALGGKVAIFATSSGAPLGLALAARFPEAVDALVLYSANIRIRQAGSRLMSWPWGLYAARFVRKGLYNAWDEGAEASRYWYVRQRLEGATQLQALLDAAARPGIFRAVRQPVYAAVYYRDEAHRDPTIDVSAVRDMVARLGTPPAKRRFQAFDAGNHVIACDLLNPRWEEVQAGTWAFLEDVVGLAPKEG